VGHSLHTMGNGMPRYFNVTNIFDANAVSIVDSYIGIFGNADPLDVSQWLKVEVKAAASNAASWLERTSTCKNAITTMNYRFFWAYVGAKSNPQAKIVGARVDFSKSDIQFYLHGVGTTRREIPVTSTATFIQRVDSFADYSPPSPPVAISVPYDVWYPFKIDSYSSRTAASSIRFASVLCALLVLI